MSRCQHAHDAMSPHSHLSPGGAARTRCRPCVPQLLLILLPRCRRRRGLCFHGSGSGILLWPPSSRKRGTWLRGGVGGTHHVVAIRYPRAPPVAYDSGSLTHTTHTHAADCSALTCGRRSTLTTLDCRGRWRRALTPPPPCTCAVGRRCRCRCRHAHAPSDAERARACESPLARRQSRPTLEVSATDTGTSEPALFSRRVDWRPQPAHNGERMNDTLWRPRFCGRRREYVCQHQGAWSHVSVSSVI